MNAPVFGPLVRRASPDDPTLDGLGKQFALPVAGILAFNPSPFSRSDVVELPDGRLRLVTDVPGLGYAFVPDAEGPGDGGAVATVRETLRPVDTAHFSMRLDQRTGAVASLVDRATGRDLVAGGDALGSAEGAELTDGWVERYPGIAYRLVARRAVSGSMLTSKATIYQALPWVDLENVVDPGGIAPAAWRFDLALGLREMTREVAGGAVTAPPPLAEVSMLRWLALRDDGETILFGADSPTRVSVEAGTTVIAHRPARSARFRVMVQRGIALPDDPWRFGFGMVPLVGVPAPGSGSLRLPSFGRLLEATDPLVAVVGVKDADNEVGVMVYLMDVGGPTREVMIRPGALAFDGGAATDLVERDREPLRPAPEGGVIVPIESGGFAAVRLLGVRVAG